jgi:hypothetical protein
MVHDRRRRQQSGTAEQYGHGNDDTSFHSPTSITQCSLNDRGIGACGPIPATEANQIYISAFLLNTGLVKFIRRNKGLAAALALTLTFAVVVGIWQWRWVGEARRRALVAEQLHQWVTRPAPSPRYGFAQPVIEPLQLSNDWVLLDYATHGLGNLAIPTPEPLRRDARRKRLKAIDLRASSCLRFSFPKRNSTGTRWVDVLDTENLQLWDAKTQKPIARLSHPALVTAVGFCRAGRLMATATTNGVVRIWNTEDGQPVIDRIDHDERIDATFFSDDSSRLFCISGRCRVYVHETKTGARVGTSFRISDKDFRNFRSVSSSVFTASPDGRTFLAGISDYWLWDVETGVRSTTQIAHEEKIFALEFSPNSRRLVTGSGDFSARVWDGRTAAPITGPLEHYHTVFTIDFHPDGQRFVTSSSDGYARIFDSSTGELLFLINSPSGGISSAEFSPDGLKFVTAAEDVAGIWEAGTGELLYQTAKHPSRIREAMFGPDSATVQTVTDDRMVQVWGIQAAEETVDRWEDACDGDESD